MYAPCRLFSVPFYAQTFSRVDPGRQAFLDDHNGTLFGLEFIPTTVLQYLRPDSLRFTRLFPFVDFAPFPGRIIGDVSFDLFDQSSSMPASLPFLFFLALGGMVLGVVETFVAGTGCVARACSPEDPGDRPVRCGHRFGRDADRLLRRCP